MSVFDRIANRELTPINRKASELNDGYTFESNKKVLTMDQENPIKCMKSPIDGFKFGRFRVIGKYKSKPSKKGALYVVRCACGMYTTRRKGTINKGADLDDCCERCSEVKYLKRKQEYLATGTNVD